MGIEKLTSIAQSAKTLPQAISKSFKKVGTPKIVQGLKDNFARAKNERMIDKVNETARMLKAKELYGFEGFKNYIVGKAIADTAAPFAKLMDSVGKIFKK